MEAGWLEGAAAVPGPGPNLGCGRFSGSRTRLKLPDLERAGLGPCGPTAEAGGTQPGTAKDRTKGAGPYVGSGLETRLGPKLMLNTRLNSETLQTIW